MSFYPPGWDYARVRNNTGDDLATLNDEQHSTLINGLREAGLYDKLIAELERESQESSVAVEASKLEEQKLAEREILAPYIDSLKLVFKFNNDWSEWGFVIFRTGQYGGEHDARWEEFRRRWELIMGQEVDQHRGYHPKSDRAIRLLRFRWVEDPALEMAESREVSRRFDDMWQDLPRGFLTSACLMVTPAAIESVLNSPLPLSAPQTDRQMLPFVVAVSRAAHIPACPLTPGEEEEVDEEIVKFKGHFNVAVKSLLDSFYGIIALDIIDLPRLAGRMRHERDVWCHPHRGGVRHYVEEH